MFIKSGCNLQILKTAATSGLHKIASAIPEVQSTIDKVVAKKDSDNFVYFWTRAVSADRENLNADIFPLDELKIAYPTFIGRGLYLDHNANSVANAVGKVFDAKLLEDPTAEDELDRYYVGCLCGVDKTTHPDIASKVVHGVIDSVSMGASVAQAECSICHKVCSTPEDFCIHLQNQGQIDPETGKKCCSINRGVSFTELSLVGVPADPMAKMQQVFSGFVSNIKKQADTTNTKFLEKFSFNIPCGNEHLCEMFYNLLKSYEKQGIVDLSADGSILKLSVKAKNEADALTKLENISKEQGLDVEKPLKQEENLMSNKEIKPVTSETENDGNNESLPSLSKKTSSVSKKAGESGGWVVKPEDAFDKLQLWINEVGAEKALADITGAMGTDELSSNLAYIFRMNDFKEGDSNYKSDNTSNGEEPLNTNTAKEPEMEKKAEEFYGKYDNKQVQDAIEKVLKDNVSINYGWEWFLTNKLSELNVNNYDYSLNTTDSLSNFYSDNSKIFDKYITGVNGFEDFLSKVKNELMKKESSKNKDMEKESAKEEIKMNKENLKTEASIVPTETVELVDGSKYEVTFNPEEQSILTIKKDGKEVGVDGGTRLQILRKLFHKDEPTIVEEKTAEVEDTDTDSYEYIYSLYVNGNLTEFKDKLQQMFEKGPSEFVYFMDYLEDTVGLTSDQVKAVMLGKAMPKQEAEEQTDLDVHSSITQSNEVKDVKAEEKKEEVKPELPVEPKKEDVKVEEPKEVKPEVKEEPVKEEKPVEPKKEESKLSKQDIDEIIKTLKEVLKNEKEEAGKGEDESKDIEGIEKVLDILGGEKEPKKEEKKEEKPENNETKEEPKKEETKEEIKKEEAKEDLSISADLKRFAKHNMLNKQAKNDSMQEEAMINFIVERLYPYAVTGTSTTDDIVSAQYCAVALSERGVTAEDVKSAKDKIQKAMDEAYKDFDEKAEKQKLIDEQFPDRDTPVPFDFYWHVVEPRLEDVINYLEEIEVDENNGDNAEGNLSKEESKKEEKPVFANVTRVSLLKTANILDSKWVFHLKGTNKVACLSIKNLLPGVAEKVAYLTSQDFYNEMAETLSKHQSLDSEAVKQITANFNEKIKVGNDEAKSQISKATNKVKVETDGKAVANTGTATTTTLTDDGKAQKQDKVNSKEDAGAIEHASKKAPVETDIKVSAELDSKLKEVTAALESKEAELQMIKLQQALEAKTAKARNIVTMSIKAGLVQCNEQFRQEELLKQSSPVKAKEAAMKRTADSMVKDLLALSDGELDRQASYLSNFKVEAEVKQLKPIKIEASIDESREENIIKALSDAMM